jgi:hypothetical protein
MEADDDRAPAGAEPLGQGACEKPLEVLEFVVDGNSQRLEDACGRVNFVTAFRARLRSGDGVHQLGCCPFAVLGSPRHDRTGDRSACSLFAEALENVGQLRFAERGQEIRGGWPLGQVKPHIERPAAFLNSALNAEAARRVGQLVGRESEVQQDAIDPADSEGIEDLGQFRITGLF